ncbi:MarR family winged helix-turn-helix transcriptional regulator [Cellulomonas sp. KRMCY2]|uniref:MarR family winged helix-turn-helix transcriptional regulator n=1 Tax=Cellulomonas sp. KRMCY2 TaxID=1304865 RepID=UPI0004B669FB|nr:MarR family transcriptional regulator [Cellulomonas sp. KRMCY2]
MSMDFFDAVVRYETHLWNHLDARLREAGCTSLGTLSALRTVRHRAGACRVQELRADLGITVGAASKLVDRLERDGLAERRPHPEDRRSSLIALTQAGEVAHDAGIAVVELALAEHLAGATGVDDTTAALRHMLGVLAPAPATTSGEAR